MSVSNTVRIAPGVVMPMMGIGTWQIRDKDTLYDNERLIGEALRVLLPKHGLTRGDVFITSKLASGDQGAGKAYRACQQSLRNLDTDYLDLFIIHFPGADGLDNRDPRLPELRKGSWLDLEKMKGEGKFRAIGVSNYVVRHLEEMRQYATVWPPALNQFEYHPYYKLTDVIQYCSQNGIHFQAYSSLGSNQHKAKLAVDPVVQQMAAKYNCSPQQLLLAWALNQGVSVLPRTSNPAHVASNYGALNIVISLEDVQKLSTLSNAEKFCWNPEAVM